MKFTSLIELAPGKWRGSNKDSDLLIEINIVPTLFLGTVITFAIAERELQLVNYHHFPVCEMVFDMPHLLQIMKWTCDDIIPFEPE